MEHTFYKQLLSDVSVQGSATVNRGVRRTGHKTLGHTGEFPARATHSTVNCGATTRGKLLVSNRVKHKFGSPSGRKIMSKGQNKKKGDKTKATKTPKEKKQAKREKREQKDRPGILTS
jgi:hypothetical protein